MAWGPPPMTYQDYDPAYPDAVAALAARVDKVLPDVQVEHVGSTAVLGLGGRGVLDVVVVCPEPDHDHAVAALHQIGLSDTPWAWTRPMLDGTIRFAGRNYPMLLYVLTAGHSLRQGLLATRDQLRADPPEADRYAQLKRDAIAAGHTSPRDYQQAKASYLHHLAAGLSS